MQQHELDELAALLEVAVSGADSEDDEGEQADPTPDADSPLDLDDLLEESVGLHNAKRAQKQGRKLTAEQAELLETNAIAQEAMQWEAQEVIAHFIHTTCSCGAESRRFSGWYKLLQHRRQEDVKRLVAVADHEGLPATRYITAAEAEYCDECL